MQESRYNGNAGGGTYKSHMPPPTHRPLYVPTGSVAFRFLCHSSRVGGVIGKSGCVVKQLQQETSSKIRVDDSGSNSDDHRIIIVIASASVNRKISFSYPRNEEEASSNSADQAFEVSAAQEAVVRVFERVIEVTAETSGSLLGTGSLISCRLLAKGSQVGSVIGKGGVIVNTIKKETGCRIKVLTFENLPACTFAGDKVVEIEGEILGVKKALIAVTRRLQDCLSPERTTIGDYRVAEEAFHGLQVNLSKQSSSTQHSVPTSPIFSPRADSSSNGVPRMSKQDVSFKILCVCDKVGFIIGKGGSVVKALENETGATIRVGPTIAECYERLITITAFENLESHQSPARHAVVLVFNKIAGTNSEKVSNLGSRGLFVSARLVLQANQAGCLLGVGGTIIAEMRKMTGARIVIHKGDQVPRCASENEEVVEITGEFSSVQDALCSVTTRLRNNLLQVKSPNGASSALTSENTPYGRLKDCHSSSASNVINPPSSDLIQSMANLGISNSMDGLRSPSFWQSQIRANQRGSTNLEGGLTSANGGLELGRSVAVRNASLEIVVSENVIESVYGENGINLERLIQISGAKVTIGEPHPGTGDRTIMISGTPDETQTAQSLLQTFIINGSS